MRLYVKHIWRAFPELDRFSDEQCRRFVGAARWGRPKLLMAGHWLVQALALAVCAASGLALSVGVSAWTYKWDAPIRTTYAWMAVSAVVVLLGVLVGLLAWLWVSHVFLRRRIAWIFRARSRCGACGYMLAGLPVTERSQVKCPECGLEADVDPALGELSEPGDGSGRSLFKPAAPPTRRERARVVGRYGKRIAKWGVVVALVLAVVGVGVSVRRASRVRREVAAAKAMPEYAAEMRRVVERLLPEAGARVAIVVAEPVTDRGDAVARAFREGLAVGQAKATPGALYGGEWIRPREVSLATDAYVDRAACEKLSLTVLAALEQTGVFDRVLEITEADADWRLEHEDGWRRDATGAIDLSMLADLAAWNGARMRLAAERGDATAWERAAVTSQHIAGLLERRTGIGERIAAQGVESLLHTEIKGVLTGSSSRAMVEAVGRVLERSRLGKLPTLHFEGERVRLRAAVGWLFSDEGRVQTGVVDAKAQGILAARGMWVRRIGSLEENLVAIDKLIDYAVARATQPLASGAGKLGGALDFGEDELLAACSAYQIDQSLTLQRQLEVDRAGLPVLAALERFRLDRGRYPGGLEELVPAYLPAAASDPLTGKPFLYTVTKDVQQGVRPFVLYSPGPDGVDNGGAVPPSPSAMFSSSGLRNMDYIVNDPAR